LEALSDFFLFLGSVVVISLSGVIMPGPVFAVTVARGYVDRGAGALVAVGHGLIEFPLMVLIYFGLAQLFALGIVKSIVGLVGGGMLVFMGWGMIRLKGDFALRIPSTRYGSVAGGVVTTGANPYFFLWWATVGATLIVGSTVFGLVGFLLFTVTHWSCDFFWYLFVSMAVFKSKRLWSQRTYRIVLAVCALILIGFGGWFIFSSLQYLKI
jgi:threonine/homoserine/homoserine lactone efflux protein